VDSLSGFEESAGSGQESAKRGCEIEAPLGWDLRFLGEDVDHSLRRVGDRPQGGRQNVGGKRTFSAPEPGDACSTASANDSTAAALVD
jgi:hypothetical protein